LNVAQTADAPPSLTTVIPAKAGKAGILQLVIPAKAGKAGILQLVIPAKAGKAGILQLVIPAKAGENRNPLTRHPGEGRDPGKTAVERPVTRCRKALQALPRSTPTRLSR
jgi:hypothetical protein